MSSSDWCLSAVAPSVERSRICSTTTLTSFSTCASDCSRAASAVDRMAAVRSVISLLGLLRRGGGGRHDGGVHVDHRLGLLGGSCGGLALGGGGLGSVCARPGAVRSASGLGPRGVRSQGRPRPRGSPGSRLAGAASSCERSELHGSRKPERVSVDAIGGRVLVQGVRDAGCRRTLGGEVGCGGVARGTSGAFRWYRRVGPLRVRIGRSDYHGPMDPRPDAVPAPASSTPAAAAPRRPPTESLPSPPRARCRPGGAAFDGRPGLPDRFGRALRDLRISVTDRCNFRCPYCMPAEVFGRDFAFLPSEPGAVVRGDRAAGAGLRGRLGVGKLRITGGEPLVRRDLPVLIAMPRGAPHARRRAGRPDADDERLARCARSPAPLADAGLQRITVSLDSLDDEVFGAMNGVDFPVSRVLDGIAAAREAGLAPIKVNTVVRRGMNEASRPAAGALGARGGR